jgi:DNA polymerase-3 subunit delta
MKLDRSRIDGFLKSPGNDIRAALVYGPDRGLAAERAQALAQAIVPDIHDAFRIAWIAAEELATNSARLADETAQLSLTGGRRLIRVRDAGDAAGGVFAKFFKDMPPGDAFVLVEGKDLPARSSLRRAFEGAKQAVTIACYLDGPQEIAALARSVLGARKVTADEEAMHYLATSLGGDRRLSRMELEKLALYAGDGGRVNLADAASVVGDSADLSLDDMVMAAADGDASGFERALSRAFAEGEAPVRVLRAAMRHFERLHRAGSRMATGADAETAVASLRPPLFFKVKERFKRQLRLWPAKRAAAVLSSLMETERQVKSTGMPAEIICRASLLRIARAAMGPATRRAG